MEDDFQFVDFEASEEPKDLEQVKKDVQKLRLQCQSESTEVKKLEKEWEECRQAMKKMSEEMKQLEEERQKMRREMSSLEVKNVEIVSQLNGLKEEVKSLKNARKNTWNESIEKESMEATSIPTPTSTSIPTPVPASAPASASGPASSVATVLAAVAEMNKLKSKTKSNLKELDKSQCYACKDCGTHIGLESDVANRTYQVGQGAFSEKTRGYLFNNAVNLTFGATKTETFTSGSYEISSVTCAKCGLSMGWKYLSSSNEANASKVGKFCLARYNLTSPQERNQK